MSHDSDTTITALASDPTDTHLIVGNNRGDVTIWVIDKYAIFRRFADVVLNVSRLIFVVASTLF